VVATEGEEMSGKKLSYSSWNKARFVISAGTLAVILLAVVPAFTQVAAQAKAKTSSAEVLLEGKGLFAQRCGVCHSISEKVYGPRLSKDMVIDREDTVRQQIEQGSALMPGFQYGLKPAQIDAIIQYLSSVEPPKKGVKTQDGALLD
jgi:mono/diheme cytochrome c family protein